MTLATVRERVEKRTTSPAWDAEEDEGGLSREAGDGMGDGYARYELSADGESAMMAEYMHNNQLGNMRRKSGREPSGFGVVSMTCCSRILEIS